MEKRKGDKLVLVNVTEVARLGGEARARKLTPAQRSAIARKAAKARWAKEKKKPR